MLSFAFMVALSLRSSVKEDFPTGHIIYTNSVSACNKCIFMCRVFRRASANGLIAGIQVNQAVHSLFCPCPPPPPHHPSSFSPSLSSSSSVLHSENACERSSFSDEPIFLLSILDICRPPYLYFNTILDGQNGPG